ncbi:MAG: hypothetical protein FWF05_00365 [Oscillospiraceae bacterium]|nr:hypothetical protein [Oscillospiraceae bacterium]
MKKVLSILLAFCMIVGFGAVGTVSAGGPIVSYEEQLVAKGIVLPLLPYFVAMLDTNRQEFLAGLQDGIYPATNTALAAAFEAKYTEIETLCNQKGLVWDDLNIYWDGYVLILYEMGRDVLQASVDEILLSFESLFNETFFKSEFLNKFEAFKAVLVNGFESYLELSRILVTETEKIENIESLKDEFDKVINIYKYNGYSSFSFHLFRTPFLNVSAPGDTYAFAFGTTSFSDVTAGVQDLAARVKALTAKIKYIDGSDPTPAPDSIFSFFANFLPESVATVMTFIVRYVFFGWLWGRWL